MLKIVRPEAFKPELLFMIFDLAPRAFDVDLSSGL